MLSIEQRTVLFGFSFEHHGRHSGFNGLKNALRPDTRVIDITLRIPRFVPGQIRSRLMKKWLSLSEWSLWPSFLISKPRVFHYFFPENSLRRIKKWKKNHRVIATLHQPINFFKLIINKATNRRLLDSLYACDSIVVQTRCHMEGYHKILLNRPICYIPYGVDCEFFRPVTIKEPSKTFHVLTVGNWMRDYVCWAETAFLLSQKNNRIRFTIIANSDTLRLARKALGIRKTETNYINGISDSELLWIYRSADLVFLPLVDAMANNAILEAMAMGLPIVTTDLPATREYLGDDAALFYSRSDANAAANAIESLIEDPNLRKKMGYTGLMRAMRQYDWNVVGRLYQQLYSKLLSDTK